MNIDAVAEAIWKASEIPTRGTPYSELPPDFRQLLLRMAQAAIDALELTEEFGAGGRISDNEPYGIIDGSRGPSLAVSERHKVYDRIDVVSHWVSPWTKVDPP